MTDEEFEKLKDRIAALTSVLSEVQLKHVKETGKPFRTIGATTKEQLRIERLIKNAL